MSSSPPDSVPQEVQCFRQLIFVAQQLRYSMDQRLAVDGLTTQQAMLLGIVEQLPEPPSLSQVAAVMATSHQNVKQLVDSLERKAFLEVKPDPADGRVRRLAATRKSRQYWQNRDASDFEEIVRHFEGLTAAERTTLHELLGKLARSIEEARLSATKLASEATPGRSMRRRKPG